MMRAMVFAGQRALQYLTEHGETNGFTDRILPWAQRQDLFGLPAFTVLDNHFAGVIAANGGTDG